MKARQSLVQLSGTRDLRMLNFLWKWKVATTAALAKRFFTEAAVGTAYRRLWRLEQGGFITARADKSGRKHVWHLDKRGYETIRGHLPTELAQDGYKSEHSSHDLVASAFHLGDWFLKVPDGVKMFSEQQLRRLHHRDYPEFVPKYLKHNADGYTQVTSARGTFTLAFEAELNPKARKDYDGIYDLDREDELDFVFWLAPNTTLANRIGGYVTDTVHAGKCRHSFITYPQFLKNGWGAPIIYGENTGSTMRDVLAKLCHNSLTTPPQQVFSQELLNTAKTPHKSKAYKFFEIGDFAK